MDGNVLADLVRRANEGDRDAWDAIVLEHTNLVWSVVRRHRFTDATQAADAVQTTWLRLVENLDAIRDPTRLAGWLSTTTRHVCLGIIRRSCRDYPTDLNDGVLNQATAVNVWTDRGPEELTMRDEDQRLVRRALETLDPRDRALLTLLACSDDISYKEISERLEMPIGSIGPTRARALAKLRTALERIGLIDHLR